MIWTHNIGNKWRCTIAKVQWGFIVKVQWGFIYKVQWRFFFVSALLWDYALCWDHWKQYMTPTLDAVLLISSRAGADLGRTSVILVQLVQRPTL